MIQTDLLSCRNLFDRFQYWLDENARRKMLRIFDELELLVETKADLTENTTFNFLQEMTLICCDLYAEELSAGKVSYPVFDDDDENEYLNDW